MTEYVGIARKKSERNLYFLFSFHIITPLFNRSFTLKRCTHRRCEKYSFSRLNREESPSRSVAGLHGAAAVGKNESE
jgi:hypothetical protein